jgi:hypothetical protein
MTRESHCYRLSDFLESHFLLDEIRTQIKMELFGRNSKVYRFVITKVDVIHTYLADNVAAVPKTTYGHLINN